MSETREIRAAKWAIEIARLDRDRAAPGSHRHAAACKSLAHAEGRLRRALAAQGWATLPTVAQIRAAAEHTGKTRGRLLKALQDRISKAEALGAKGVRLDQIRDALATLAAQPRPVLRVGPRGELKTF